MFQYFILVDLRLLHVIGTHWRIFILQKTGLSSWPLPRVAPAWYKASSKQKLSLPKISPSPIPSQEQGEERLKNERTAVAMFVLKRLYLTVWPISFLPISQQFLSILFLFSHLKMNPSARPCAKQRHWWSVILGRKRWSSFWLIWTCQTVELRGCYVDATHKWHPVALGPLKRSVRCSISGLTKMRSLDSRPTAGFPVWELIGKTLRKIRHQNNATETKKNDLQKMLTDPTCYLSTLDSLSSN